MFFSLNSSCSTRGQIWRKLGFPSTTRPRKHEVRNKRLPSFPWASNMRRLRYQRLTMTPPFSLQWKYCCLKWFSLSLVGNHVERENENKKNITHAHIDTRLIWKKWSPATWIVSHTGTLIASWSVNGLLKICKSPRLILGEQRWTGNVLLLCTIIFHENSPLLFSSHTNQISKKLLPPPPP